MCKSHATVLHTNCTGIFSDLGTKLRGWTVSPARAVSSVGQDCHQISRCGDDREKLCGIYGSISLDNVVGGLVVPLDRRNADLLALLVILAELFPLKPLEERRLARCAVAPGVEKGQVNLR